MGAGHHNWHSSTAAEERDLAFLMREDRFRKAAAAYTKDSDHYHIPYLAGSSDDGRTVYFDPDTPKADRKFIRIHEVVEGVLIRKYGFSYAKAHHYATIAERQAVGKGWNRYQASLRSVIAFDEHEKPVNLPPDLLAAPYKGTRFEKLLHAH